MERKTIVLTADDARLAIYSDHQDFEVISDEIVDHGRWNVVSEAVLLHKPSGEFYRTEYSVGATEYQDERPFDGEDKVVLWQVFPIQKTVTVYE